MAGQGDSYTVYLYSILGQGNEARQDGQATKKPREGLSGDELVT